MRALLILVAALLFGLAGGYTLSTTGAKPTEPRPQPARFMDLPASPEEAPADADREWESRSIEPSASAATSAPDQAAVYYPGCNAVRAAGKAPLHADEPGYRIEMDGDGDGLACEPIRHR